MQIDNYFTIGTAHIKEGTPCEDFSIAEELRSNLAFGVVADGCSGARAYTDEGARALSFAFRKVLQNRQDRPADWFDDSFTSRLIDQFRANSYTGNANDRLATVVGFVTTDEDAAVYVFGDGAYAMRFNDGRHRLVWFEWYNNMPFYLGYKLSPSMEEDFRATLKLSSNQPLTESWVEFTVTGSPENPIKVIDVGVQRIDFTDAENGFVQTFRPREDGIEALAVLTDGIHRIGDITSSYALAEFFAYKNFKGSFVKRRMMRALEQFAARGQRPQDDLAMSCVWFE